MSSTASSTSTPSTPSTHIAYIDAHELQTLLTNPTTAASTLIVDVRDEDFKGGNIAGALNVPSEEFRESIDDIVEAAKGKKLVVCHCMLSQSRGPKCAKILNETLIQQGKRADFPEIAILASGFKGWARHVRIVWIHNIRIQKAEGEAGFAQSQQAYEDAFHKLFAALDRVETILASSRYLVSQTQITLADVRLFTTLIRFDTVYHGHFKTNQAKILEYSNLYNYMKELYQIPSVRHTVDHHHIKQHYMASHKTINPLGIVSLGPKLDALDAPHDRETKFTQKK